MALYIRYNRVIDARIGAVSDILGYSITSTINVYFE